MTTRTHHIAGYDAIASTIDVDGDALTVFTVDRLEGYVDRAALLRGGEDAPEPPYWAYLWSGARLLAARVPHGSGHAIEVGCGLALPGLAAARRGWRTTLLDRVAAPLRFARASVDAMAIGDRVTTIVADMTSAPLRRRYDLVLAAEVLYDRAAFAAIAGGLATLVAPGGTLLLADGHRIDTRAFYPALTAAGFAWTAEQQIVREEGLPVTISLVTARLR